jgi:transposase
MGSAGIVEAVDASPQRGAGLRDACTWRESCGRNTLAFQQEAVRLVRGGRSLSSVAGGLGVSAQSIDQWVKAEAVGGLKEAKGKPVNADQMEIARLKAELAKTRMKRDFLEDFPTNR